MSTERDTRSDASIDIRQELADLFEKEDMVAYFDVTSSPDITPPLSGICKIAKPLAGTTGHPYISLLFIMDTPDADARRVARECMKRIDEDRLTRCASDITSVVMMPETIIGDAYYVRHIDVLLTSPTRREIRAIVDKIYEAIREAPALEPGELVWWESTGADLMNGPGNDPADPLEDDSIITRIRKRLGIKLK